MTQHRRTLKAGLLTGALVGVPLGVLLAWGLVQRARGQAETTWAPVPVLVAARALPAGHVVGPSDLVEAAFPSALVTDNCVTPDKRRDVEGRTLRWALEAGAVVRATDLVVPSAACAARLKAAGARLGLTTEDTLLSTLATRHGGAP